MGGKDMNTYRQVFGVISTILFFLVLSSDVNAQCEMKGTTVRDTKVYNRAPHFYTGSGWKLGDIVTTLPANTNVMICEKTTHYASSFSINSMILIQLISSIYLA